MGKYSSFSSRRGQPKVEQEIHPIWRGIGLMMIVLIPFLSYVASLVLIDENSKNGWFRLPADLIISGKDPLLMIKIILTLIIAFLLYVVFMFLTFILYRFLAPPRYGPMDAPQRAYRGKKNAR